MKLPANIMSTLHPLSLEAIQVLTAEYEKYEKILDEIPYYEDELVKALTNKLEYIRERIEVELKATTI